LQAVPVVAVQVDSEQAQAGQETLAVILQLKVMQAVLVLKAARHFIMLSQAVAVVLAQ
jgi:hypothetical protein